MLIPTSDIAEMATAPVGAKAMPKPKAQTGPDTVRYEEVPVVTVTPGFTSESGNHISGIRVPEPLADPEVSVPCPGETTMLRVPATEAIHIPAPENRASTYDASRPPKAAPKSTLEPAKATSPAVASAAVGSDESPRSSAATDGSQVVPSRPCPEGDEAGGAGN